MPQETHIKKLSNYLSGSRTLLSATMAFKTSTFAVMRRNRILQKCTALTLEKQIVKLKVLRELSSRRKMAALCAERHHAKNVNRILGNFLNGSYSNYSSYCTQRSAPIQVI